MRPDGVTPVASSESDGSGCHRMGPDRNRFAVNRKVHGSSPCSGATFESGWSVYCPINSRRTGCCEHVSNRPSILTQWRVWRSPLRVLTTRPLRMRNAREL